LVADFHSSIETFEKITIQNRSKESEHQKNNLSNPQKAKKHTEIHKTQ
jgi:hypothetical protein